MTGTAASTATGARRCSQDQHLGGGLLWASGDLVALLVLGALFVQWAKASEREAVREDRRLDRLEAQAARDRAAGR